MDTNTIISIAGGSGVTALVAFIGHLFVYRRGKMDVSIAMRKLEAELEQQREKDEVLLREEERAFRREHIEFFKEQLRLAGERHAEERKAWQEEKRELTERLKAALNEHPHSGGR